MAAVTTTVINYLLSPDEKRERSGERTSHFCSVVMLSATTATAALNMRLLPFATLFVSFMTIPCLWAGSITEELPLVVSKHILPWGAYECKKWVLGQAGIGKSPATAIQKEDRAARAECIEKAIGPDSKFPWDKVTNIAYKEPLSSGSNGAVLAGPGGLSQHVKDAIACAAKACEQASEKDDEMYNESDYV